MTNLGPLTSIFTPGEPGCTSTFVRQKGADSWPQYGAGSGNLSNCYPEAFNPDQFYYYSPGICPSGYATACQALSAWGGKSAENYVTCCPSSYLCNSRVTLGDPFPCKTEIRGGTSLVLDIVSFDQNFPPATNELFPSITTVVFSDPAAFWTVFAYGIVVQTADSGGETSFSRASNTAIATSPQNTSPATSDTGTSHESSSSLSKAATIGVGVGVGLAAIAIIVATIFVVSRRRRRRRSIQQPQVEVETLQDENKHINIQKSTPFELDSGR
ncbi:hypothetical protein F5Y18DRAFT_278640 [Xylariaceae sp. FL1019]|nr:hypothetical protein F5Y18DRAFT_278640 [Xylariaceae sp. FL1019]